MKYGTNLISGEVFCVFIFFHFSHSGLSVLNGLNFFYSRWRDGENREQSISGMSLNCPEMRNEYGKSENEIWEQNRELEMKLLIGLGFKLGYFPFFIFPFTFPRSPFLVPRSSFLPLQASSLCRHVGELRDEPNGCSFSLPMQIVENNWNFQTAI